jgi:hypothetical protein
MTNRNRDADRYQNRTVPTDRSATACDEAESVSQALVETIAAREDVDPTELPVLAEPVDPEALDELFGPRVDGSQREVVGRIELEYDDYRVTVTTDGTFTVCSATNDR